MILQLGIPSVQQNDGGAVLPSIAGQLTTTPDDVVSNKITSHRRSKLEGVRRCEFQLRRHYIRIEKICAPQKCGGFGDMGITIRAGQHGAASGTDGKSIQWFGDKSPHGVEGTVKTGQ